MKNKKTADKLNKNRMLNLSINFSREKKYII